MDLSVLERSPEAGDPAAVDDLVSGYVTRAERFAERATSVRAAAAALVLDSRGQWSRALKDRAERWAAGSDDAAHGCRQAAEILARYAAELRGLTSRVLRARDAFEAARSAAVVARRRYDEAVAGETARSTRSWQDPPRFPAHPQGAADLRVWKDAVNTAAANLRSLEVCCSERDELDWYTAERLVGIDIVTLYAPGTGVDDVVDVALVHAFAAATAGTLTSAQLTTLAAWFEEAVENAAKHADEPEVLRALQAFLDTWGDDARVMAGAFSALGAERTVRLVHALGHEVQRGGGADEDLVALGRQFRTSFAIATSGWDDEQVQQFVDELFGPVSHADGTGSVIAYLFADRDGARMTAAFTVAVADRIDARERLEGQRLTESVHPPGYWLEAAAMPGSEPGYALDPASAVLGMLGLYPARARAWLTGAGESVTSAASAAETRVDYWFGSRDWSVHVSDGFAGLGRLWAGVQQESAIPSPELIATINNDVFEALTSNRAFNAGALSAEGSTALAHALAPQLPQLIELGTIRSVADPDGRWLTVDVPFLGETPAAIVSNGEFAVVLSAAVEHQQGQEIMLGAVVDYQAKAIEAALAGIASPDRTLDRIAAAWGSFDGATEAAQQAAARLEVEERLQSAELGLTGTSTVISLLPIPSTIAVGIDLAFVKAEHSMEQRIMSSVTPGQSPVMTRQAFLESRFTRFIEMSQESGSWDMPQLRPGATGYESASIIAQEKVTDYMTRAAAGVQFDADFRKTR